MILMMCQEAEAGGSQFKASLANIRPYQNTREGREGKGRGERDGDGTGRTERKRKGGKKRFQLDCCLDILNPAKGELHWVAKNNGKSLVVLETPGASWTSASCGGVPCPRAIVHPITRIFRGRHCPAMPVLLFELFFFFYFFL